MQNFVVIREGLTGNPDWEDTKWSETSTDEMRALFGIMIIMGIQYLPQDRLYWDKDEFIRNSGIRKTLTVNRFHKLMEYVHISDRATEAQRGDPNYDKLAKIRPMLEIVQQTF